MQIKKGPYGYYAIEKIDDPDRLCTYAEEVIAGNKSDFYLTPSTEYIGSNIMCCYEFSDYLQITDPEFSVFSQDRKNSHRKNKSKNLSMRRKSAGDLFYTFVNLLDNLISPSLIVLDPNMIFTDPEGISIKICCIPVKSKPEELSLSSLGASRFENLLNNEFFKRIITDDERNALVFSVKENNEDMFLKIAKSISGSGITDVSEPENLLSGIKVTIPKTLSKNEKELIISFLSAFLSLALLLVKLYLPCFLFLFLSTLILVMSLLNQKKLKSHVRKAESLEKSRQRSSILFSETSETIDQPENENTESFIQTNPLSAGQLTLVSDSYGVNKHYSLYLDETTIGSDCFLSDIIIDKPEIAPLHAVIKQRNGSYYLEPSKGSGKTYIENSPIENGKSYEIKSGQIITFGDIEFRFGNNSLAGTNI